MLLLPQSSVATVRALAVPAGKGRGTPGGLAPGPSASKFRFYKAASGVTRSGNRQIVMFNRSRLTVHERERLPIFAAMSINDTRHTADEFDAAKRQYESWLSTRRERRAHAANLDEQTGYAPEVQYGNPSPAWRKLEAELRKRRLWQVSDLPRKEQIKWAKKLNALSDTFSKPERRRIGPDSPKPEVRSVEP
jgi:hypothetical protein